MTIDDATVVDVIVEDEATAIVRLLMTDRRDWSAEHEHLRALQDKLNRYLAFVEGGELVAQSPHLAECRVRIEVTFRHEPTPHAREGFLLPAQQSIREAGMDFVWTVGT